MITTLKFSLKGLNAQWCVRWSETWKIKYICTSRSKALGTHNLCILFPFTGNSTFVITDSYLFTWGRPPTVSGVGSHEPSCSHSQLCCIFKCHLNPATFLNNIMQQITWASLSVLPLGRHLHIIELYPSPTVSMTHVASNSHNFWLFCCFNSPLEQATYKSWTTSQCSWLKATNQCASSQRSTVDICLMSACLIGMNATVLWVCTAP